MIVMRIYRRLCDYAGTRNKTETLEEVGMEGREKSGKRPKEILREGKIHSGRASKKEKHNRRDRDQDRHMATRMRSGCDH